MTPVIFKAESSFIDVVNFFVEGNTEEIKKVVKTAKQEVKEEVQNIKKNYMDSNTRNPNEKHSEKTLTSQIQKKITLIQ